MPRMTVNSALQLGVNLDAILTRYYLSVLCGMVCHCKQGPVQAEGTCMCCKTRQSTYSVRLCRSEVECKATSVYGNSLQSI